MILVVFKPAGIYTAYITAVITPPDNKSCCLLEILNPINFNLPQKQVLPFMGIGALQEEQSNWYLWWEKDQTNSILSHREPLCFPCCCVAGMNVNECFWQPESVCIGRWFSRSRIFVLCIVCWPCWWCCCVTPEGVSHQWVWAGLFYLCFFTKSTEWVRL